MQKDIKKLTLANENKFFDTLEVGDTFKYSGSFKCAEVMHKALEKGIKVVYNSPGTPEYAVYGCNTFNVQNINRRI